ncbi:sodium/calcium exchanger membrane region, EF-hand domain pair [Artemisia annua]|uniref:Sodium/calcium exchanger membrane region, EF-hand domain pair n=1 Tax=Artemisia annua TaxID=35608 RepID=A0A2U1K9D2_ARTAN|nr:sodium/calcium exchanger membrane region, EF-hand domain pair [Artemisia annua]
MVKVVMKLAAHVVIILFMLVSNVASRRLSYDAPELVSDGVSNGNVAREEESFLRLKEDSSEEQCELMYGFLPCSSNIPSHVFLIVIYEYLLYHGESYAGGDGRIFRFLGKNFFVFESFAAS